MGFDENRFTVIVDEEFKCSICQDIVEDPVWSQCEHIFCKQCINEWLQKELSCPVDRKLLNSSLLCEPSRFFRNLYSRLELKCVYEPQRCVKVCKMDELKHHENECEFNPMSTFVCEVCGAVVVRNEALNHNCIHFLKTIINNLKDENEKYIKKESEQEELIKDLQNIITTQNVEINELKQKTVTQLTKTISFDSINSRIIRPQSSSKLNSHELKNSKQTNVNKYEKFQFIQLIESLKTRGTMYTPSVEKAMLSVNRKLFCSFNPNITNPYSDEQQSLGFGSTISAPHIHALILELIKKRIKMSSNILDIGSGIGYLTICMAQMVGSRGKVIAIEHVKDLIDKSQEILEQNFKDLLNKVKFVFGDGRNGYLSEGPYDVIIIGGAVTEVQQTILDQLKRGGRLIAAINTDSGIQALVTIDKMINGFIKRKTRLNVNFEALTDIENQINCFNQSQHMFMLSENA